MNGPEKNMGFSGFLGNPFFKWSYVTPTYSLFFLAIWGPLCNLFMDFYTLGIRSYSQIMIRESDHLLSIVFRLYCITILRR